MNKTILFVTYGGGHATMVAPLIRLLREHPGITTHVLALTLGGPYFRRQGLPYVGFKDFIEPGDEAALAKGRELVAAFHHADTGIEEDEAIAYHGLSYADLAQRLGTNEAARLWDEKHRNAFHPLSILERVMDRFKPDMVVTTNSPRAEYAAQIVAHARGIPTLAMYDLFGLFNFYQIQADYVAVISPLVVDYLRADTGLREGQQFLLTGNPAFDLAFDHRGPIDYAWRRAHFPTLPDDAKVVLWIDEPAYHVRATKLWHYRVGDELTDMLDELAAIAKTNNAYLLIRPHPSQERAPFHAWMERTAHPHVMLAVDVPLYPLLNAVDVVVLISSTVGCEALMVGRPVIQLDYYDDVKTVLLGEWGIARMVKTPAELSETLHECFVDPIPPALQMRIDQFFPQGPAAPKVVDAILTIVSGETERLEPLTIA